MYSYDFAFSESVKYFNGDELAAKVFLDKYALRNNEGEILEDTPEKMHRRIAKEFARIEKSKFKEPLLEEEIFGYLDRFKYIIPQGSPMSGIGNDFQIQSLGNCFVIPPVIDSYGGILMSDQQLVQLMKRRAGVGFDISNIRPKGIPTKNSAKTTDGIGVFMERFSNSCREVAQNGRRGALLLCISVHHPEIETFITIKRNLKKVTGANISVKLTDEFMRAVENNEEYELRWPVNSETPKICKKIKAKEIWDQIIESAWACAEPGLLFWDKMQNFGLSDQYKKINPLFEDSSCNPCVRGDTLIKTRNGNIRIDALVDQEIEIWNGFEWSLVTPKITGQNQEMLRITLNNGKFLICTKYHKWILKFEGEEYQTEAQYLITNDTLFYSGEKIICIEELGVIQESVYCFNEPVRHLGEFNGIITGNCGEIGMGVDSCRLLLMNLYSYVENPFSSQSIFNYDLYSKHCQIAQRLMDDLINLELEKIDRIIDKIKSDPEDKNIKNIELELWIMLKENCELGRRTGLGITGLGDAIAALNIKYGSEESIKITEKIYYELAKNSMKSSCLMAKELGAFPLYNEKIEKENLWLKQLFNSSEEIKELHEKYGRRNISLTTTAPAGTVSILCQTTSGIEPAYLLNYTRRRKINPDNKMSKVDFTDDLGDKWEENEVYHHHLKTWMKVSGETDIKKSPYWGATSNDVNWEKSVEIQSVGQRWITHSISKTCNLPKDASKDLVSKVYLKAWKTGCKGFTVYRDGCRSGVLIDKKEESRKINKTIAPKRPKILNGESHTFLINKQRYYVVIGLLEGEIYETFSGLNYNDEGEILIPKSEKLGKIVKNSRGNYVFETETGKYALTGGHHDDTLDALTRLVSCNLRHGADISFVVGQLEKTKGPMNSFAKVLSRTIKSYIKDGTKVEGETCSCGGSNIVRENGCKICKDCGASACS